MTDAALVVLAAAGPLQTAALVVVVVVGFSISVGVRLLVRRSVREGRPEEPPTQPDDLDPGQR